MAIPSNPKSATDSWVDLLEHGMGLAHQILEKLYAHLANLSDLPVAGPLAKELASVEQEIRLLGARREFMSEGEARQLGELRDYRSYLRDEINRARRPVQLVLDQTRKTIYDIERSMRRLSPREEDWPRMSSFLEALAGGEYRFRSSELQSLRSKVRRVTAASAREAELRTAATGVPEAEVARADGFAHSYLLPALDLRMEDDGAGVLRRLARLEFDSPEAYALNAAAHHLSLVSGFEELLSLPLLRGVEQYPYQIATARQVLRSMRGRALLCDEVGLGKTIEAGIILKEYLVRGLARKVLILAPPSLVSQWQEEMSEKFDIDLVSHDDPRFRDTGEAAWEQFDRVISSLATARHSRHRPAIERLTYDLVIVDEAHHLKNRSSLNWKFVNSIKSKYLLLLTATPAQNNLDELFNLITLLSPGQLKTVKDFRKEFVQTGNPRQPRNRNKLSELLLDVMVRNSRSQVSVALPPRRAATLRVSLTAAERSLYDGVSQFVREHFRDRSAERLIAYALQAQAGSSVRALRATLERMKERHARLGEALDELLLLAGAATESAKGRALLELLGNRSEKVLVFTQFRETLSELMSLLSRAGIPAASFRGGMSAAEKDAQIAAFEHEVRVLVSTDIGSEGRNLQFCHVLANFDLPWNPMKIEQRVGRLHRVGQKEPVQIFNLAAHNTLEDYILEVLESKINMFELVVGEIGSILGNLDDDREFEEIVLDLWVGADSDEAAHHALAELGDRVLDARRKYLGDRNYHDALLGQDFQPEDADRT